MSGAEVLDAAVLEQAVDATDSKLEVLKQAVDATDSKLEATVSKLDELKQVSLLSLAVVGGALLFGAGVLLARGSEKHSPVANETNVSRKLDKLCAYAARLEARDLQLSAARRTKEDCSGSASLKDPFPA